MYVHSHIKVCIGQNSIALVKKTKEKRQDAILFITRENASRAWPLLHLPLVKLCAKIMSHDFVFLRTVHPRFLSACF